MTPLEASHRELRAALIVAGRRINTLTFRSLRKSDPTLAYLRQALRDARKVAKAPPEV